MFRSRMRFAFRRSRVRLRVCEHLRRHGRTDARALMLAMGVTAVRFDEVLHGGTARYRAEESLVGLGLVRVVRGSTGPALELTPKGLRATRIAERLRERAVPL